eukprot:3722706-Amphidinium_carterae.1
MAAMLRRSLVPPSSWCAVRHRRSLKAHGDGQKAPYIYCKVAIGCAVIVQESLECEGLFARWFFVWLGPRPESCE